MVVTTRETPAVRARPREAPKIVAHFGGMSGPPKFTEIGEPSVASIVPALTSAIFKITGKRIRSLPLKNHDLSWS